MRAIDALTVQVLVENTSDSLSGRPAHVVSERRILMENGLRELSGEAMCTGHHGLCLVVTAKVGAESHTLLFDVGPDDYALARNGPRMGVDFGAVAAVVLSHGHYDHFGGIRKALELVRGSNGRKRVPFYLHPGAFVRRGSRLPDGSILPLASLPSAMELTALGAVVSPSAEPQEILDGTFWISGEVPMTSFEQGVRNQVRWTPAGTWEPDPWVRDERFMVVHLKEKGLVVFTGCSHPGIVNILTHTRAVFPDIPLYGVVGGLHLVSPNEGVIPQTVQALQGFGLKFIEAGHCTGWRGLHALATAFGESVVDPLNVGTRWTI